MSTIEELITKLLNGDTADFTPQSRVEAYLKAAINGEGDANLPTPQSRLDALLYELAANGTSVSGETPQTYILLDENGEEYPAVVVSNEVEFTATDNDVREGMTYASSEGASTGTKVIPAYHVTEGYQVVMDGSEFRITDLSSLDRYDFTKLQVIICPYAGSIAGSVSAEKVVIGEAVYAVNSTDAIATVVRDSENKSINLGITNDSGSLYLLRYFTYKEIY